MLKLIPMTEEEYPAYLETAITDYAQDKIAAGNWQPEEAQARSEQEFHKLLPDGTRTEHNHLYMLLDEDKAQKVGMIWFILDITRPQRVAFICDFVIYEVYRRHGYGLQALLATEELAQQMGAQKMELHVFAHNNAARALYEKAGYQVTNLYMGKSLETNPAARD